MMLVFQTIGLIAAATVFQPVTTVVVPSMSNEAATSFAVDARQRRAFVTSGSSHSVNVVDLRSGASIRRIPSSAGSHVFFRTDADRLYVVDGAGAVSAYTGELLRRTSRAAAVHDARAAAYDPSLATLFLSAAANTVPARLVAIDGGSFAPRWQMPIDGANPIGLAVDLYRPRTYLLDATARRITVVDRWRRTEIRSWPIATRDAVAGFALDEDRSRLYVATRRGELVQIDSNTGRTIARSAVAAGIDALAFDAAQQRLYVVHDGRLDIERVAGANDRPAARKAPTRLPVHARFAEALVRATLSEHSFLRKMGLHAVPPGGTTSVIIANGNATRVGIPTTAADFRAVASGRTYGPDIGGIYYNMKMPMYASTGARIGLLVMEIPGTSAVDANDAMRIAESIRRSMSARVPTAAVLFDRRN